MIFPGLFARICALLLLILLSFDASSQVSSGRMMKEGDRYFEAGLYRNALKYYEQGGSLPTWKKKEKLRVAIAQYEINQVAESIQTLKNTERQGKTDPQVYLYLGKAYQQRNLYKEAISYYKQFLRKKKADADTRTWVKDEILRCANGLQLAYGEELAFVENLGSAINTLHHEYLPIPSATYQDRIYFTSNRKGSIGGKINQDGIRDDFFGEYQSDMYTLDQVNGAWEQIAPLGGRLNTRNNEMLYDISPNGQILYYMQGDVILTDTFDNDATKPARKGAMLNPMNGQNGDQDLQVFNDSIMLFSSNRPGGYGGYDLYISAKRFGRWTNALNLGPEINGYYDERHPLLAGDGRTLFFSSNNLHSIGGFDIFSAVYLDGQRTWTPPKNLGLPINSAANDEGFALRNDGLSAFFSSDRKDSYGGRDIYLAYFKEQIKAHLTLSTPITFLQVMEQQKEDGSQEDLVSLPDEQNEIKEYYINDLFYEDNDVMLTPQNIKKLDLISNMMQIYPKIILELICHDSKEGPASFTVYFSVKKAEKIRDYLIRKGVPGDRVWAKGAGNKYPLAKDISGQSASPIVRKLNRRVDVRFHNVAQEPLKIRRESIQIPVNIADDKGKLFNIVTQGLYYQIELLSATQMYQNELIDDEPHVLVTFDADRNRYTYLVGLAQTYASAKEQLSELMKKGYGSARVAAFLNGRELKRNELIEYADEYPDLLNFFE